MQYKSGIYKAPFPGDAKRKNNTTNNENARKMQTEQYKKWKTQVNMDINDISIEL